MHTSTLYHISRKEKQYKRSKEINMSSCSNTLNALMITLLFLLLRNVMAATSSSDIPDPSTKISPETACSYTPDPVFCKSFFSSQSAQNLYSYSTYSLSTCLSDSTKFLDSINQHLSSSAMPQSAVMALQDCQLLFDLNIDFLTSACSSLSPGTSSQLADSEAETLQAMLDAVLTNQQTCLQSLQETATVQNDLSTSLANGTKLSSVSLALFKHAWTNLNKKASTNNGSKGPSSIPKKPKHNNNKPGQGQGRKLMLFHEVDIGPNGELPLKMSSKSLETYFEKRSGRKLLQSSSGGSVLVTDMVVVSQDGTGDFKTITEAVNKAPNNTNGANGYHLIFVSSGVYKEYVSIAKNKKYLMMVGDGINQTVVTGDHNNVDGWTTFNSPTFAVVGQGFVAINMTFRNTAGAVKHQAVALRSGADLSTFHSCSFEGYQDTLYTHSLRQFYRDCDIYGTVDFIFGNAAVVLQNCNIYPRLPMKGQSNTITAQGRTDPNQNTGISIHMCNVAPAENLGSTKTYLGRPWKEYSRTVIMKSVLGSLIDPTGWMPWSGTFALSTLYYAEYSNTGAGSGTSGRVTWAGYHKTISSNDALNFTVTNFIIGDNWLPQTGVPYSSGL